ncbi:hypothetical protein sos41_02620 [Alphaproteobacteria bacterium SO-S41]|nr:hypothetical protein sos41_02620 [Alphaproteobacteria bacterium SO-S41]
MATTFQTNPVTLKSLLENCESGEIQLPDFQRSWVWDDERLRSLIASISDSFPVGALMTLQTGGDVNFKPRMIQGAPPSTKPVPGSLLLDGQQRMTSLYQTLMRREVVATVTARRQKVKRWYYIDMEKALDKTDDREDAIVGVPEDRQIRANFGKDVKLDLSTPELEYEHRMFPANQVFDYTHWLLGFVGYWSAKGGLNPTEYFMNFKRQTLDTINNYQVPVITLGKETSREAVCLVFEKVNTGGKPLDAFELVTAMYAADGFELRKDWFGEGEFEGRVQRLKKHQVLADLAPTEFLQAIALLHTKAVRAAEEAKAKAEAKEIKSRELPAISANRQSLLHLPLDAYKRYADQVEQGFERAAKFLRTLRVYRTYDLPYQTQLVPLAATLAELGKDFEHDTARRRISQWYWCGVFGELYGSAVESRFALDIADLPAWARGGEALPATVVQATVRADRLRSMRSRLSAAYKGVNALLMKTGARDFRSGQDFDAAVFYEENVDIHHIFPKDWCRKRQPKIDKAFYDSIVNKTPLSARTNRIIGGEAPSAYLAKLETGGSKAPPIAPVALDHHLTSHLIAPVAIRSDDFYAFFKQRQEALLSLIEHATGRAAYREAGDDEPVEDAEDVDDETDIDESDAGKSSADEGA